MSKNNASVSSTDNNPNFYPPITQQVSTANLDDPELRRRLRVLRWPSKFPPYLKTIRSNLNETTLTRTFSVFRIHIHWIRIRIWPRKNLNPSPDPNCFLTRPGINLIFDMLNPSKEVNWKIYIFQLTYAFLYHFSSLFKKNKIMLWWSTILNLVIWPWFRIPNPDPEASESGSETLVRRGLASDLLAVLWGGPWHPWSWSRRAPSGPRWSPWTSAWKQCLSINQ